MAVQIQIRRGTAIQWSTVNPILAQGELGIELDTDRFKIGNGIDNWNDLSYSVGQSGYSGFSGVGTSGFSGFSGTGSSGYSGASGVSGFIGISGYSGTSGYSGAVGIPGLSGQSGLSGESGLSGLSGYSGQSIKLSGSVTNYTFLPNGVPAGEIYIVLNSGGGYNAGDGALSNGDNTWTNIGPLQGPPGYSGFSGESGVSGFSGIGVSGFSGESGISGFSGESGVSGYSGESGFSGFSGESGVSGFSGESGVSGFSGTSGFSGESGVSGFSGTSGESGASGFSGTSGESGLSGFSGVSGFSGESGVSGFSGISGTNGVSAGTVFYFDGASRTQTVPFSPPNDSLLLLPNQGTRTIIQTNSIPAGSPTTIANFVTAPGALLVTNIIPGLWISNLYAYESLGAGNIVVWIDVNEVASDGTTVLGNIYSGAYANGTTITGTTQAIYIISDYVGPYTLANLNSRIQVVIKAQATNNTKTLYIEMRDSSLSNIVTTIASNLIGDSGYSGFSGVSGISGVSGYSGISGYSGESGTSGFSGASGQSGDSGYSGISGYSGYSGISGALSPWTLITSNYTAVNGDRLIVDTQGGSFTIYLPESPVTGDYVQITDGYNLNLVNCLVDPNGSTIEGLTDIVILDLSGCTFEFIYQGTTWEVTATTGASGTSGYSGIGTSGFSGFSGVAGPVGGSDTQVLYNSSNVASGSSNLTWDNATNLLTVIGNITGNTNGFPIGYRDIPQISFTTSTTLGLTDAGKHYYSTLSTANSITVPVSTSVNFAIGTTINIINNGTGTISVLQDGGVSIYLAGNAVPGNRSITANGVATLTKVETNTWYIVGTGVS